MAIGIMTNTSISLGDMSMIMDYLDNEAYLDTPDEDTNTIEITKPTHSRKIVKPKLSDDALINKFSLVRVEQKMKQEDNILDVDSTVLDGADDIDFSFDDFDSIGTKEEKKDNVNSVEKEETDDFEIEGLDEELNDEDNTEQEDSDEITDDDLESLLDDEDSTEQEDESDIDLENVALLIQQQLANAASNNKEKEETDNFEIEGLDEELDDNEDSDELEIEGIDDLEEDEDDEENINSTKQETKAVEQKDNSNKSEDETDDFEIEGLDEELDDNEDSDEITDDDLESLLDENAEEDNEKQVNKKDDNISKEKAKDQEDEFSMDDLNDLLADDDEKTEESEDDIDEIDIDAMLDEDDTDEENDTSISNKNNTHYSKERTDNSIIDNSTKQLEEQIKEKEKQNELLLKLQALEEENRRLKANASSKESKQSPVQDETQLRDTKQDKTNETAVKKEAKQDDIIDRAIKSQTNSIKDNEVKASPYDKYTVMNIDSLYNTVKKYMLDKGVKQKALDITDLNNKFGADNIRKLIVKQYLIKTKKGVTVGL